MSEWQPIETAPRDGQYVDLWLHGGELQDGVRVTGCEFDAVRDEWIFFRDGKAQAVAQYCVISHWMQIPPPPSKDA